MLSIVIVNWNTREHVRACLESLRTHPCGGDSEIIVVDNASEDGAAEMVRASFPEVRLLAMESNLGYAAGNNRGFAAARGDLVLALNPDTVLTPGALDSAVNALAAEEKAGCVAARLLNSDGTTQASVRGFPTIVGVFGDLLGLGALFPDSAFGSYRLEGFDYEARQWCPQPMGTFLLLRRRALADVGEPSRPFDEGFPIFFNEVDLLYRMSRAGWRCLYCPQIRVFHAGGASTKQVRPKMIWESHRGLVRFFSKHYRTSWNYPLYALVALLVMCGAFFRTVGLHARTRA